MIRLLTGLGIPLCLLPVLLWLLSAAFVVLIGFRALVHLTGGLAVPVALVAAVLLLAWWIGGDVE